MKKRMVFQGGDIVLPDRVAHGCLVVEDGVISGITQRPPEGLHELVDVSGKVLLPGGVDTHVHITEPSPNSHRENWKTGSRAAAAGGITTIVQMPVNQPPVADRESFAFTRKLAEEKSCVDFALWGALIPTSVDNMEELNALGCVAYKGFMSNGCDFYPRIPDEGLLRAMGLAHGFGGMVGVHAEHAELAEVGAAALGAAGCTDYTRYDEARPWWVELEAIQRALLFAEVSKARLYICHLSAVEGIREIREAKRRGMDVTAETCPHYLLFTRDAFREKGGYAKCNPPLRSAENREKLWEYVFDGTLDTLGSDHGIYRDEHTPPAESFWSDMAGFPGIDIGLTAFYSEAVTQRGLPLPRAAALAAGNAAWVMGLSTKGNLLPGADADIVIMDFNHTWQYDGTKTFSGVKNDKGIYHGRELKCRVMSTYVRGQLVYDGKHIVAPAGGGHFIPRSWKE